MIITASYKRNYYQNGIEIYFNADPGNKIKNKLLNNNWRYHGKKKCWYIYFNDANEKFAKNICDSLNPVIKKQENNKNYNSNKNTLAKKITYFTPVEIQDNKKCSGDPIIPRSMPIGYYVPISPKDERYRRKRSMFS